MLKDALQMNRLKSLQRSVISSSDLQATVHTMAFFHGLATLQNKRGCKISEFRKEWFILTPIH